MSYYFSLFCYFAFMRALILTFSLVLLTNAFAQNDDEFHIPRNAVQVTGGIVMGYSAGGAYERILIKRNTHFHPILRAGGGHMNVLGSPNGYATAQLGFLMGRPRKYIELCGGPIQIFEPYSDSYTSVTLSIGYRYIEPKYFLNFRTGISIWEGIYFGIGYSFDRDTIGKKRNQ